MVCLVFQTNGPQQIPSSLAVSLLSNQTKSCAAWGRISLPSDPQPLSVSPLFLPELSLCSAVLQAIVHAKYMGT
jgi:hypothetical protein